MSLITCRDCNSQISNKAAACPHCGRPVSDYSDQSINIQKTPKKYKLIQVLSLVFLVVSLFLLFGKSGNGYAFLLLVFSATVGLWAKVMIWWHAR
jgi:uncharacterized membrane protein YvbJ